MTLLDVRKENIHYIYTTYTLHICYIYATYMLQTYTHRYVNVWLSPHISHFHFDPSKGFEISVHIHYSVAIYRRVTQWTFGDNSEEPAGSVIRVYKRIVLIVSRLTNELHEHNIRLKYTTI